jgi:biopolymer transport protein ExbD
VQAFEPVQTFLIIQTKDKAVSYQINEKPISREQIVSWFLHNSYWGLEVRPDAETSFDTVVDLLSLLNRCHVKTCKVMTETRVGENIIVRSFDADLDRFNTTQHTK